jgi:hypothetical protein
MNLPESVLLCLFPNGLVLSRQSAALGGDRDGGSGEEEDEEVYAVDVRTLSCNTVSMFSSCLFSVFSHFFFQFIVRP